MIVRNTKTLLILCLALAACRTTKTSSLASNESFTPIIAQIVNSRLQGNIQTPSAQAETLLKKNPGDPYALEALALRAMMEGRWAKATLLSEILLRQDPKSPIALNLMGLVLWQRSQSLEEDRRALTYFLLAAEADPKRSAARLNLALLSFRLGQNEQALKEFEKVKAQCSSCSTAWVGTALIAYTEGKRELALKDLALALAVNPDDSVAQNLQKLWLTTPSSVSTSEIQYDSLAKGT